MRRRAARWSWALLVLVPGLVATPAPAAPAATAPAATSIPSRWTTPLGTGARYAHTWLSGIPVLAVPVRAAAPPAGPGTLPRGTLRRAELSSGGPGRPRLGPTPPPAGPQGALPARALPALAPHPTAPGLGGGAAGG